MKDINFQNALKSVGLHNVEVDLMQSFYGSEKSQINNVLDTKSMHDHLMLFSSIPKIITIESLMIFFKSFYEDFFNVISSDLFKIEFSECGSYIGLKVASFDEYLKLKDVKLPACFSFIRFHEAQSVSSDDPVIDFLPDNIKQVKFYMIEFPFEFNVSDSNIELMEIFYCRNVKFKSVPKTIQSLSFQESNLDFSESTSDLNKLALIDLDICYETYFDKNFNLNQFLNSLNNVKRFAFRSMYDADILIPNGVEFLEISYENLINNFEVISNATYLNDLVIGSSQNVFFNSRFIPLNVKKLHFSSSSEFTDSVYVPLHVETCTKDEDCNFEFRMNDEKECTIDRYDGYGCLVSPVVLNLESSEDPFDASLIKSFPETVEVLNVNNLDGCLTLNNDLTNLEELVLIDTSFDFSKGFQFPDSLRLIEIEEAELSKLRFPKLNEGLLSLSVKFADQIDSFKSFSSTIKDLVIVDNVRITTLPKLPDDLEFLELVSLQYLHKLPSLKGLKKLKKVIIQDCPRLESFPMFDSSTLEELVVEDCPKINDSSWKRINKFLNK